MERVPNRYDDGLELHPYQGMEVHEYEGMNTNRYPDANRYPGASSEEKEPLDAAIPLDNVYEEDLGSRLHRGLKTRQICMIALGGALGTGLLINTGPYLADAGPGSMLIGYALVGILCFTVMSAMGEMATWLPLSSSFTGWADRFVDPALGFAVGWNYWFHYIITTPNNIIASVLVVQYWWKDPDQSGASAAVVVTLLLALIITINYFGVSLFGEFEFWMSSAKMLILLCLIIFTLVLATHGGSTPAYRPGPGVKYWNEPGAFAAPYGTEGGGGKFLGFWNVLTSAVFSFLGAELVGVTVGEAQNPRKAVPRAVRLTFFRIVFFYLMLVFLLGLVVPYNNPRLQSTIEAQKSKISAEVSPFVIAAQLAGFNDAVANVINACLLVFTVSAANSDLYIATRTLYSLSVEGSAPKIFSRTTDRGVPIYALGLSSACCLVAFVSAAVAAFKVFQYFISLVTIFGLLLWIAILISHIYFVRARKAQKIPDSALAYVSLFGARGSMVALVFALLILLFNGFPDFIHSTTTGNFDWANFIVDYIGVGIFAALYFGYKLVMKTNFVTPMECDLYGGKAKIDEDEAEFLAEEMRLKGGVLETKFERAYRYTLGNFF